MLPREPIITFLDFNIERRRKDRSCGRSAAGQSIRNAFFKRGDLHARGDLRDVSCLKLSIDFLEVAREQLNGLFMPGGLRGMLEQIHNCSPDLVFPFVVAYLEGLHYCQINLC